MNTLADVAKMSGVSVGIVSHVLNRTERAAAIPPQTQDRIRLAAKALNYAPDRHARYLRKGASTLCGVMADSLWGRVRPWFMNALYNTLLSGGKDPLLVVHRSDRALLEQQLGVLRSYRASGLIVAAAGTAFDDVVLEAVRREGEWAGPLVWVSFIKPQEGLASVAVDAVGMWSELIRLFAADGRQRGVYASVPYGSTLGPDCFRRALARHAEVQGAVLEGTSRDYRAFGRLFAPMLRDWAKDGPIGVCAPNDVDALALIQALSREGVRIPEDVAVVGRGDDPRMARLSEPSLTSFDDVDGMAALAAKAVETLEAQGQDKGAPPASVFLPRLYVRESFAPGAEALATCACEVVVDRGE